MDILSIKNREVLWTIMNWEIDFYSKLRTKVSSDSKRMHLNSPRVRKLTYEIEIKRKNIFITIVFKEKSNKYYNLVLERRKLIEDIFKCKNIPPKSKLKKTIVLKFKDPCLKNGNETLSAPTNFSARFILNKLLDIDETLSFYQTETELISNNQYQFKSFTRE